MGRILLIQKHLEKDGIFYYKVFKEDASNEVDYYIGLDPHRNLILFFKEQDFNEKPVGIWDRKIGTFSFVDNDIESKVKAPVILKSIKALNAKEFPFDISWYS